MPPDTSQIPDSPGVYLMKDKSDTVIYVGKARSLKNRVRQYFQSPKNQSTKTKILVEHIEDLEYIVTDSEVEALVLEANLIRKHKPRYNIQLKDDKRYPYVKVTINSRFPKIFITRRRLMDGAIYFGPYTNVKAIRKTLDIISQIFQIRRCHKKINGKPVRPCLNSHIKRCLAPCTGKVSEDVYMEHVMDVVKFLKGDVFGLIKQLENKMDKFASAQEYEAASMIRDQLVAIKSLSRQQVSTAGSDDRDVIAAVSGEGGISVQLFYVRDGNMVGRADISLTRGSMDTAMPDVLAEFIKQYYQDSPIPPEILVEHEIPDKDVITEWLSQRSGHNVSINVPLRGQKRKLLDMAAKNAKMSMELAQLKPKPHEAAQLSLVQLKDVLSLDLPPGRIETFDISNISGTDAVGSIVVFENGMPIKSEYRQFNIKTVDGIDDFAMMGEVVQRRYARILKEHTPMPDLILVDGGAGQVSAAHGSLLELGLDIPLIGLAKKFEHIVTIKKGAGEVIILPHTSMALKLLMQMRDEAHRFAVSAHRRKRSARLTHSTLDGVPGIGTMKKRALLGHFGSVDVIMNASVEELSQVEGISVKLAESITEYFKNRNQ
ncbi:MAG: excinuclease ABC subunit UvrC [Methanosarcinaceae archaeon]|nr:excinuclease ABC subunit UvrC [Methanosarcinaceae archaeon]